MLSGYADPVFPGYLGNLTYLVVMDYPAEGAQVQVKMVDANNPDTPFATVNFTISAGTTPFMANYSCDQCYALGSNWYTYITYLDYADVDVQMLKDISLSISTAQVGVLDKSLTATLGGLTVGVNYYVTLRCEYNSAVWGKNFVADSESKTISETTGIQCFGQKYLILSSGDDVHKTVYALDG